MQRNLRIDLPKKIYSEIKSSLYLAKERKLNKGRGIEAFQRCMFNNREGGWILCR
jgi:hypothetical protein